MGLEDMHGSMQQEIFEDQCNSFEAWDEKPHAAS